MNTKKTIYTKDKSVKITFRCDEALSVWISERSKVCGITPSAFVRQLMYQQLYAEKTLGEALTRSLLNEKKTCTETAVRNANY